jgi:hypothetical protein
MAFTIVDMVVRICCRIPHYDILRTSPRETAGTGASTGMRTCFVAGAALLSLSLATGIWLAAKL